MINMLKNPKSFICGHESYYEFYDSNTGELIGINRGISRSAARDELLSTFYSKHGWSPFFTYCKELEYLPFDMKEIIYTNENKMPHHHYRALLTESDNGYSKFRKEIINLENKGIKPDESTSVRLNINGSEYKFCIGRFWVDVIELERRYVLFDDDGNFFDKCCYNVLIDIVEVALSTNRGIYDKKLNEVVLKPGYKYGNWNRDYSEYDKVSFNIESIFDIRDSHVFMIENPEIKLKCLEDEVIVNLLEKPPCFINNYQTYYEFSDNTGKVLGINRAYSKDAAWEELRAEIFDKYGDTPFSYSSFKELDYISFEFKEIVFISNNNKIKPVLLTESDNGYSKFRKEIINLENKGIKPDESTSVRLTLDNTDYQFSINPFWIEVKELGGRYVLYKYDYYDGIVMLNTSSNNIVDIIEKAIDYERGVYDKKLNEIVFNEEGDSVYRWNYKYSEYDKVSFNIESVFEVNRYDGMIYIRRKNEND